LNQATWPIDMTERIAEMHKKIQKRKTRKRNRIHILSYEEKHIHTPKNSKTHKHGIFKQIRKTKDSKVTNMSHSA